MDGYAESDLVRISILVNGDLVDALSFIAHRAAAETRAGDLRAAEGVDPEAAVQDRYPGGDRWPGDRAGDDQRAVEGRDRESATAATSPAAELLRSRKRARSECGNSVRSRSRNLRSWLR